MFVALFILTELKSQKQTKNGSLYEMYIKLPFHLEIQPEITLGNRRNEKTIYHDSDGRFVLIARHQAHQQIQDSAGHNQDP